MGADPGRRPAALPGGEDELSTAPALERVRAACLALPAVEERPSHGAPTFFVEGKKSFVMFMDNHHSDGRVALWCAAAEGIQEALVERNPDGYFKPPYVGHRGWIGVRVDRGLPWDEIEGAIEDAWAHVAPKRLLDQVG